MMFSGKLDMRESDPSSFSISFMFCTSVLFIAPISGTVVTYIIRKISVPMNGFIQLNRFSRRLWM